MSWRPEIPPREQIEATFPRDVFGAAVEAFDYVFWLDLPQERQDELMQRAGDVEEQLDEIVLIWNRLGDDRINQIEALRDSYAARDEIGASSYTVGRVSTPSSTTRTRASARPRRRFGSTTSPSSSSPTSSSPATCG